MRTPEQTLSATLFHNHLDSCEQCRNNPFNLCRMGRVLLKAAATVHDGPTHLKESLQAASAEK